MADVVPTISFTSSSLLRDVESNFDGSEITRRTESNNRKLVLVLVLEGGNLTCFSFTYKLVGLRGFADGE